MCYTALIYKTGDNDKELNQSALDVFAKKMDRNSDGFSFISKNKDNKKFKICKTLDENKFKEAYDKAINDDISLVHFRIATAGIVSEENTHFWKNGEYYFSHNGGITGGGDLKSEMADSRVFFNQLYDLIKDEDKPEHVAELLKAHVDVQSLWGRGFLIDTKKDLIYMFGDLECYLLNDNYIVIASAVSSFERHNRVSFGEMVFDKEYEDLDIKETDTERDEINILDLKKGIISKYIFEEIKAEDKKEEIVEKKTGFVDTYNKEENDKVVDSFNYEQDNILSYDRRHVNGIYLPVYQSYMHESEMTIADLIWGYKTVNDIPDYLLDRGIAPDKMTLDELKALDGL